MSSSRAACTALGSRPVPTELPTRVARREDVDQRMGVPCGGESRCSIKRPSALRGIGREPEPGAGRELTAFRQNEVGHRDVAEAGRGPLIRTQGRAPINRTKRAFLAARQAGISGGAGEDQRRGVSRLPGAPSQTMPSEGKVRVSRGRRPPRYSKSVSLTPRRADWAVARVPIDARLPRPHRHGRVGT